MKQYDLELKAEKVKVTELRTCKVRVTRNSGLRERHDQQVASADKSMKKQKQQAKKHKQQLRAKDQKIVRARQLSSGHRRGKRVADRKLTRWEKKAERDRDPNAKPGNI